MANPVPDGNHLPFNAFACEPAEPVSAQRDAPCAGMETAPPAARRRGRCLQSTPAGENSTRRDRCIPPVAQNRIANAAAIPMSFRVPVLASPANPLKSEM
jgi:hypothetical protein